MWRERISSAAVTVLILVPFASACGVENLDVTGPSGAVVRETNEPREPGPSLRVVSWNIKGSNSGRSQDHLDEVVEVIEDAGADVVLLQEVHRNTIASGGIDQFALLSEALGMNGCFGESLKVGDGSYGNAVLTTGTVGDAEVIRLPGDGEPRTILRCVSTWSELEAPVMTTHLTAWDRANRRTRELQVNAIRKIVDGESPLLIIGGDFNASLRASEMRSMMSHPILSAVLPDYVVTHRGTGRHYDHLFVGDGWKIDDGGIRKTGPSDHWPIVATLSWGAPLDG